MLIKLLPDQISTFWGKIKPKIVSTIPAYEGGEQDMINVLNALLIGQMECWAVISEPDAQGNKGIVGFIVTQIVVSAGGTQNLLIYCLWSGGQMTPSIFQDGRLVLSTYARSKGCKAIIGFSNNKSLIDLSTSLGADTSQTVIVYPL